MRYVLARFCGLFLVISAFSACGGEEKAPPVPQLQPPEPKKAEQPPPLPEPTGKVVLKEVKGDVQVGRSGTEALAAATAGMELGQGDTIVVGPDGAAEVEYDDGSIMKLFAGTRVKIAFTPSMDMMKKVMLLLGRAWFSIGKLMAGSKFEVVTATAIAGVRGTVFRVSMALDGAALVRVERGEVRVSSRGRAVTVAESQETSALAVSEVQDPAPISEKPDEKWVEERQESLMKEAEKLAEQWADDMESYIRMSDKLIMKVSADRQAVNGAIEQAKTGSREKIGGAVEQYVQDAETAADQLGQIEGKAFLLEMLGSQVKADPKRFGNAAKKVAMTCRKAEASVIKLKEQTSQAQKLFKDEIPAVFKEVKRVAPEVKFNAPPPFPLPPPAPEKAPEKGELKPAPAPRTKLVEEKLPPPPPPETKPAEGPKQAEQPKQAGQGGKSAEGSGRKKIDVASTAKDILTEPQADETLARSTIGKVCPLPAAKTKWESPEALKKEAENLLGGMDKILALNAQIVPRKIKADELKERLEVLRKAVEDVPRQMEALKAGRASLGSPEDVKKSFALEGELHALSGKLKAEIARFDQQIKEFEK